MSETEKTHSTGTAVYRWGVSQRATGEARSGEPPDWLVDLLYALVSGAVRALAPLLLAAGFAADVLASGLGIAAWTYAASVVVSIVVGVRLVWRHRRRKLVAQEARRVLLHGALLAVTVTGVPTWIARGWDFRVHQPRRAEVAERLAAGDLPPRVDDGIGAPCGSGRVLAGAGRLLAARGTVLIARDDAGASVFFFREVGWFGDGTGYLYRSDGSPPPDGLFGCSGTVGITSARRLDDQWFWAVFIGFD